MSDFRTGFFHWLIHDLNQPDWSLLLDIIICILPLTSDLSWHEPYISPDLLCATWLIRLMKNISEMESCPHSCVILWIGSEVMFVSQQNVLTFVLLYVFVRPGRWGEVAPSAEALQPQLQQLPGGLRTLHPVPFPPELQPTRYQPHTHTWHAAHYPYIAVVMWKSEFVFLKDYITKESLRLHVYSFLSRYSSYWMIGDKMVENTLACCI